MKPDLKLLVLDLATEDFIGLWEVAWRANSAAEPNGSPAMEERLRSDVTQLLVEGFVGLYVGIRFDGDEVQLDQEQASAVIKDPNNWLPSASGELHYRIAATDQGEAEYRRRYTA